MTAKNKAKKLIDTFTFNCRECDNAKLSALFAVDEIIKVCPYLESNIREDENQLSAFEFQFVSYWQEVRQEIYKL